MRKNTPKQHVNTENTLNDKYRKVLEKINEEGFCPFCEEHFLKYHPKPIHFKTKYWTVTDNGWPYDATKHHFLMVYRPEHICHIKDLPEAAIIDKFRIENKICKKYGINGGTIMMRFGSSHDTGASVEHLHFHIVVPDKKNKKYDQKKGIVVRIG